VAHDQTFKDLLRAFFPEFMALFFPRVAARLDFTRVTFRDKELFTDIPEGERRELDLVAEIATLEGEPELVLIHTEVQADRAGAFPERMCRYYWLLRLRTGLRVFPIVLYLAPGAGGLVRESHVERFFTDDEEEILTFRYHCVGLPDLEAAPYLESENPLAPALAALMRTGELRRAWLKARSLERTAAAPVDEARRSLLVNVIETYLELSDTESEEFRELIGREDLEDVREMLTVYEERGIARGRVEGTLSAKRELVLRAARLKFGPLPEAVEARVAALAREEELNACHDRVILAATLAETGLLPPAPEPD
jgi:hypothetical protein